MTDGRNRGVATILNGARPESRRLAGTTQAMSSGNLADLLERVLDKGLIIAGDITLCLGEIELLQIKIRLLIASVDKARDMGIDWWRHDPALSSAARKAAEERDQLLQRLDRLEAMLAPLIQREPQLSAGAVGTNDHAAQHSEVSTNDHAAQHSGVSTNGHAADHSEADPGSQG